MNKLNEELKSKIITLQHDLANGEAVQQDFVRLSQSLQVRALLFFHVELRFIFVLSTSRHPTDAIGEDASGRHSGALAGR